MIEPRHLSRVRTVEDLDGEGTRVSDQVFRSSSDTVFPLQAALGLRAGPDAVRGTRQPARRGAGRHDLPNDPRRGRAPGRPAGPRRAVGHRAGRGHRQDRHLRDAARRQPAQHERADRRVAARPAAHQHLHNNGHLGKNGLVHIGEITGSNEADIEDLFDAGFYLQLVNGAYADKLGKKLTLKDLPQAPRIASGSSATSPTRPSAASAITSRRPTSSASRPS